MKISIQTLIMVLLPVMVVGQTVVRDAGELALAIERAGPGETVLMASGEWRDLVVSLNFRGTEGEPVSLMAETPGQTYISGQSLIELGGQYGVVSGLQWRGAYSLPDKDALLKIGSREEEARGIRITNSSFEDCNPPEPGARYAWIRMYGTGHRVDHCAFAGQSHSGVTVQIVANEPSPSHQVDHNLFRDRVPGTGNGFEMIQIGQSKDSRKEGNCLIANNWFVRCDGETEIVSIKTGNNRVEDNLFLDSSGSLTLRHGTGSMVTGNHFIGRGKKGSGGVRVVDSGHRVANNLFTGLTGRTGGVVVLYCGISGSPLNGYFPAHETELSGNLFRDNSGNAVYLNGGFGRRNRVLLPQNISLRNNLWLYSGDGDVAIAGRNPHFTARDNRYEDFVEPGVVSLEGFELLEAEQVPPDNWYGGSSSGWGPAQGWIKRSLIGPDWALPIPELNLFSVKQIRELAGGEIGETRKLREKLLMRVEGILKARRLYSVTGNDKVPPSGDKKDYYSTGPYWWPDPDSPDGLPYINIDGKFNPERDLVSDRAPLHAMIREVWDLAMAYAITGEERYAEWGHQLLFHWFLDPESGMNPNLKHAQAIPGRTEGRGTGIIDTHPFAELMDAILILESSPGFPVGDQLGLQSWFSEYLDWLLYSPNGRDEADSRNNHGTAFDLQAISLMAFLGRHEQMKAWFAESVMPRIDSQIMPDGTQPHELARTRTWSYCTENLEHFFKLGAIGRRHGVDLFAYESPEGGSLRKALEYLLAAVCNPSAWQHPQETAWQEEFIAGVLSIATGIWPDDNSVKEAPGCLNPPDPVQVFLLRE